MRLMDLQTARQWGFRRAVWARVMRLVRPWLVLVRVNVRDIYSDIEVAESENGISIREPSPNELLAASSEHPNQLSPTFVNDALTRHDFCVAAFDGSRMIGWVWGSVDKAPHDEGLAVQVNPPYLYGYKGYTAPEYRGRRIWARIAELRNKIGAERGCSRFVGFVESHNHAAIQANKRLGNRLVGYAGYIKFFGKSYPFRTPGVVKHTFRYCRA